MDMQAANEMLSEAINDYPKHGLDSAAELIIELNKTISSPITAHKLKAYSKTLDLSTHAWEAESISSLLLLLNVFDNKSLEEVVEILGKNEEI